MNKKLMFVIILVLIIAIVVTGVIIYKRVNTSNDAGVRSPSDSKTEEQTERKLDKVLNILSKNYYVKFSGKFKTEGEEKQNATVEYTKKGTDYAMNSENLNIGIIKSNDNLYSISHKYKMIVKLPITTVVKDEYDISLKLDGIRTSYEKDGKETIGGINYEYEEYKVQGTTTKCYFLREELKYIRIDKTGESNLIKIETLDSYVKESLFNMPSGYTSMNAS